MRPFLSVMLVFSLGLPVLGQQPETIEQAIAQVQGITDPNPLVQDRKRAEAAFEIVTKRMKVVNDGPGWLFQRLPVDFWNALSPEGNIKARTEVLDFVRAKGWDLGRAAWIVKAGACDEHASVMHTILRGAGVRNVQLLRSNSPHVFPVVNLAPGADPDIPWTWGNDAFVPDSWLGQTLTTPRQVWTNRHCFNDGTSFVSVGTQSTREKLAEMVNRGRDYCEQHRDVYQRLYQRYLEIPDEIREKMAFRPLKLAPIPAGAVLVQVRDKDKHTTVSGATVLVTFPGKNEGLRTGTTDGNGKANFASLPGTAGKYQVHVVKQGYKKATKDFELLFDQGGEVFLDLESAAKPALAVKMEWNTATDVDLWVIEPDGTKCYYSNRVTKSGATLHQDITTGYGPEHFTLPKAANGEYQIKVHYYSGPRDKNTPRTQVRVEVTRDPGTPQASTQHYTVTLSNRNDVADVCRVRFEVAPEKK